MTTSQQARFLTRGLLLGLILLVSACVETGNQSPLSPKGEVIARLSPNGQPAPSPTAPRAVPSPEGADQFAVSFLNALRMRLNYLAWA